jgi:hypothetical protein
MAISSGFRRKSNHILSSGRSFLFQFGSSELNLSQLRACESKQRPGKLKHLLPRKLLNLGLDFEGEREGEGESASSEAPSKARRPIVLFEEEGYNPNPPRRRQRTKNSSFPKTDRHARRRQSFLRRFYEDRSATAGCFVESKSSVQEQEV